MMKTGTLDGMPGLDGPVPVGWPTKREARLLRLIAQGLSPKEIAAILFVSPNTARGHIADLGRAVGDAHVPPRAPLSQQELRTFGLQTRALDDGPIVMVNHPPNCTCAGSYCRAVHMDEQ